MSLPIVAETVPLKSDTDGVVRIGNTRVTLETVIGAFLDGASAEEIASQYPSLELADIYAVIAYYLRRHQEVGDYLRRRGAQAEAIQTQNETRSDPAGIRERLLARRRTT
jgi:uncharacterized protein (DUF433 family)